MTDPRPVPARTARRLLLVTAWLLAGIAALLLLDHSDTVRSLVWSVDRAVHDAGVALEHPTGVALARGMSVLGGVYVTAPLRVVVGVTFAVQRRWWHLAAWCLSIALAEVVVTVLKSGFDRARPAGALEVSRLAAFPSGHAATASVTVLTLLLLLRRPDRPRAGWWWVAGTVFVTLMGVSRVYLRVHWPSDVVMGWLLGAAAATLAVGAVGASAARWAGRHEQPGAQRGRRGVVRRR